MNNLQKISDFTFDPIQSLLEKAYQFLAAFAIAIVILILGWLVAKLIRYLVKKALTVTKVDEFALKTFDGESFQAVVKKNPPSIFISSLFYWIVLLIFLLVATETLGWSIISEEVVKLISYLPKLFVGIIIFIIGLYIGYFVRRVLRTMLSSLNISGSNIISTMAFYVIVVLMLITAMNQAGINTSFITSNLSIAFGGVFLAFAIAFGFAARPLLQSLLASNYGKNEFKVGDKIDFNGTKGTIHKITNVFIIVKDGDDLITIPIKEILENQTRITRESKN